MEQGLVQSYETDATFQFFLVSVSPSDVGSLYIAHADSCSHELAH